jgi:hypothetical protein
MSFLVSFATSRNSARSTSRAGTSSKSVNIWRIGHYECTEYISSILQAEIGILHSLYVRYLSIDTIKLTAANVYADFLNCRPARRYRTTPVQGRWNGPLIYQSVVQCAHIVCSSWNITSSPLKFTTKSCSALVQWDCASSRMFVATLMSFLALTSACLALLPSKPIETSIATEDSGGSTIGANPVDGWFCLMREQSQRCTTGWSTKQQLVIYFHYMKCLVRSW